jgi:hypothetical protein
MLTSLLPARGGCTPPLCRATCLCIANTRTSGGANCGPFTKLDQSVKSLAIATRGGRWGRNSICDSIRRATNAHRARRIRAIDSFFLASAKGHGLGALRTSRQPQTRFSSAKPHVSTSCAAGLEGHTRDRLRSVCVTDDMHWCSCRSRGPRNTRCRQCGWCTPAYF